MLRPGLQFLVFGLLATFPSCQISIEPIDPTIADRTEARIFANQGWQRVLEDVSPGDVIEIHAAGFWSYSSWYAEVGPAGTYVGPAGYARISDRPFASLLCGVNEGTNFNTAVPGYCRFTVPVGIAGSLDFAINDVDVRNNEGELSVTVIRRTPLFHTRDVVQSSQ